MKKLFLLSFFVILSCLFAQTPRALPPSQGPEDFVKAFYAEYYKGFFEALDKKKNPYPQKLIQTKRYFDNSLYVLLQKEKQRAKIVKDICGVLDFDPFMAAQDDAGPVTRTQLIQKDSKTQVKVTFANFGGNHSVVVDLKKEPEGWKIANFIYPPRDDKEKGRDLIGTLKILEKEKCQ